MRQDDLYQKLLAALDALPRIADALNKQNKLAEGAREEASRVVAKLTLAPEIPTAPVVQDPPPKPENATIDPKELRATTKQHFLDLIKRKGRDVGLATLAKFGADHFDKVKDADLNAFREACRLQ